MKSATQPPFLRVSDPVAGRQMVPLVAGERITLGRAPSNRIVVHDERASRFHAEVFSTDSGSTPYLPIFVSDFSPRPLR